MAKSRSLQQAVRFALATATAAAGVSALHAQEAPAPAAAAAPVEEVVVTGSRLSTPNETSISPITTVSAVDLQQTGLTRVEDVLNNLPMVFAGMNSTTSNGADGTASVDLRGLGNQRTLVLVDGLRLGPGSALGGRNYSDINQIPAALIERVDVLTGGASAVYGADAVAGVVNFILNTHFEGVRIDAGYHFNEHDNKDQDGVASLVTAAGDALPTGRVDTAFGKNASILIGSNFADNKGNATAYVTYDNQGAALQSKFDYSACTLGVASATTLACGGSGTSKGGRFYASTPHGISFIHHTVLPNGTFAPIGTPGNNDTFNYGPLNYYQTPAERWTAGTFVNYDVNSHVNVYLNVMYTRNSSQAQIAPSGDFAEPSFVPCADPMLTAQERATMCTSANLAAQGNPFESYNGVNYPGLNMEIERRNVEGGNRIATFINNAAREVMGVKGDFADSANAWTYNVYAQHGTVENADTNLNYLGNPLIEQALNVLPGTSGPVCGGPTANSGPLVATPAYSTPTNTIVGNSVGFSANKACVPYNLWAPNAVTAQQLAFMTIPLTEQGTVEEYVVDGSVTGDLGKYGAKLPWADQGLQVNVGAEWRSEYSAFIPDYEEEQGNAGGGGGAAEPITGEFNVKEAFTEMRLPLASHQPGAEDLSIEGGYRYSKYSEGFDTNTYKFGGEWAPIRDVRFRGSYQRAVRAPNIGELYTPNAVLLDGSQDPCTGATPTASKAACVASGLNPILYGHLQGNPAAQYNGLLGGNPNLKPETADTYTFGVVLQPRVVPNLTFSADYFNIKIKDVIGALGGNTILLDCLATMQPTFCSLVHRDAAGSLWKTLGGYIEDTTVNAGEYATKGIDFKSSYRQPLPALGSLLFSLEGTRLQSIAVTPVPGFGSYDCVGYFGNSCGAADPKWRWVFNAGWSTPWDGLDLNLRWRYIGEQDSEQTSSNSFLAGTPYTALSHIPAYNYIDLTGTFNVYKNIRLELGVNNLFDKAPPLIVGGDCSTGSGFAGGGANCNGNTYPGVYDALGRYLFATITAQF
ncbi:MAG TPA: TonB-dependent receptor [Steroidobacteraceae bacterium]|jgi:iron complex outermembrane receptor protein|nr:TonB-dependent receptor [Steroidobacteraceae bacterium]